MENTELDIRGVMSTLVRRWRTVAATFAAVLGMSLIATLTVSPHYTATAEIYVDVHGRDLLDPGLDSAATGAASSMVDSEVEIARSKRILASVVTSLSLVGDAEFGAGPGMWESLLSGLGLRADPVLPSKDAARLAALDRLAGAVSVRRLDATYLFEISATSVDPQKAAAIANAVAGAYIEAQLATKVEKALKARDILESRLSTASLALVSAEQDVDEQVDTSVENLARHTARLDIALLHSDLGEAIRANEDLSLRADAVHQAIAQSDWGALAEGLADEDLAGLIAQRRNIDLRLGSAATGAQQAEFRAERDRLDAEIADRSDSLLRSLRQDVTAGVKLTADLRRQLRAEVLASDLPPVILTGIYATQQNAVVARSQYERLLGRVSELDARAGVQMAHSRIVSEALPPTAPSFPNTRLILVMTGFAGLGLGVGFAVLQENYLGGFTTDAQVEGLLHIEIAAVLPAHPLSIKTIDKSEILSPADLMHLAPMSRYAEAIRRLRANIDIALSQRDFAETRENPRGRTILVTSAAVREGKSSAALSLARAYALTGRKTLLIDCDLRRPSVHTYLGLEPEGGLIEYIKDGGNADGLMHAIGKDRCSPLSAIVSGRSSTIPTDQIVASPYLAELIDKARAIFDVIVLDSPPLVPVVDGLYLARYADCIALVVQWGATAQSIVRQAVKNLRLGARPDAPILAVLNRQRVGRDRYADAFTYDEDYDFIS